MEFILDAFINTLMCIIFCGILKFLTLKLEGSNVMISRNHRMACVGRDFKIHLVPTFPDTRVTFHYTRLLQSPSHLSLNISREMEHPQLTLCTDMLYIWALKRENKVAVPSIIKTCHLSYPWCFACLFRANLITRVVVQQRVFSLDTE